MNCIMFVLVSAVKMFVVQLSDTKFATIVDSEKSSKYTD